MAISLKEVKTQRDFSAFIYLPKKIHKGHSSWLPPIYADEKKYFDPKRNPSFRSCDYRMLLAIKEEKPVGRIMGIINLAHNQANNLKNVRFGFLECYNDRETAHALISAIETWGREKGMDKCVGPFGFSDRDIQGLLIEGFEYEPVVDSACNFEYMPELVTRECYSKDIDCVIYRCPVDTKLPEIFDRMYKRVLAKKAFQFCEFTKRSQLKTYIIPVLRLVNESFAGIYGFVPWTTWKCSIWQNGTCRLSNPRFIKLVLKDGKVMACLISMPNMYKGLQKAKGRLFPLGIFHILKAMKQAQSINTMLGAVHPDCQKQGLDLFLGISTIEAAKKAGMKSVEHTRS